MSDPATMDTQLPRQPHSLVLGLGDSGLAMARWCARSGHALTVWDSRDAPPQAATLAAELPGARLITGALPAAALQGVQRLFKSPGLAPGDARLAAALDAARAAGLRLEGELDLYAQALAALKAERGYMPRVIAITGTNGKTTTTALTAQLVARCGLRVAVAGNIGPTLLDTLAAALDAQAAADAAAAAEEAPTVTEQAPTAAPKAEAQPGASAEVTSETTPSPVLPPEIAAAIQADAAAAVPVGSGDANAEASGDASADANTATGADTNTATGANTSAEAAPQSTRLADDAPVVIAAAPPPPPEFEHLPQVWVLELSSFQLEGVQGFVPDAAAVLNISQDHLDWHGDMAAYARAKRAVLGDADGWAEREATRAARGEPVAAPRTTLVINADDAQVEAMVPAALSIKGGRGQRARSVAPRVLRFGLGAPRAAGDFGLVTEAGMAWLVRAMPRDETLRRQRNEEDEPPLLQRLMPADALRIRGRHNAANALAALALATAIGCPLAPLLHGLRDYRGEPHRVQPVGVIDGVEAYDDSKGTNVGATVAALDGLGLEKAPGKLVVILGGDGKGQDFAPLCAPLARHARAVALIGRDAPALEKVLAPLAGGSTEPPALALRLHEGLPEAVRWALAQARPGDALLLSPACASLDMFRNYAHRAEVFVQALSELAAERGQLLQEAGA